MFKVIKGSLDSLADLISNEESPERAESPAVIHESGSSNLDEDEIVALERVKSNNSPGLIYHAWVIL